MDEARLARLRVLIETGEEWRFYLWGPWRRLSRAVLRADRWECQMCKARGSYRRAVLVHHVKHLRDRPDLALSPVDPETGERQLISVCRACHRAEHPDALAPRERAALAPTAERWD